MWLLPVALVLMLLISGLSEQHANDAHRAADQSEHETAAWLLSLLSQRLVATCANQPELQDGVVSHESIVMPAGSAIPANMYAVIYRGWAIVWQEGYPLVSYLRRQPGIGIARSGLLVSPYDMQSMPLPGVVPDGSTVIARWVGPGGSGNE